MPKGGRFVFECETSKINLFPSMDWRLRVNCTACHAAPSFLPVTSHVEKTRLGRLIRISEDEKTDPPPTFLARFASTLRRAVGRVAVVGEGPGETRQIGRAS